ncbi:16S rRNA (guanine(527)-N(7))-methyltransferase RsmG [Arhodomonas aquaeolei]|uniref:16S rRNA (guanine(527)-N(7))-methyltransferase RsmG n=1 Tax=Arhodomonas aquaeolei TaxID=2369 RepID=UPI0003711FE0|nr:16S rRNA (guanine(527)-N(7))-methyltransferase RsmG [Arhodomonas aquaeolei]
MPEPDSRDLRRRLDAGLEGLDLDLPESARDGLIGYLVLLARWNRAFNLSAVREPREMVVRHLLDSLAVLPRVEGERLLDLGTGAGLPGIPLAVARPSLAVTLLDSNGKKARFLRQAVMTLGLDNCEVVHGRGEQAGGTFDAVTARAFTSTAAFWRLAAPRLAAGGHAYAMKGRYPADELSELAALGVSWAVRALRVPGLDAERHLIELTATPAQASQRDRAET